MQYWNVSCNIHALVSTIGSYRNIFIVVLLGMGFNAATEVTQLKLKQSQMSFALRMFLFELLRNCCQLFC